MKFRRTKILDNTAKTDGRRPGRGHPRGLFTLFFTEMWERFSFYGMRALLVLYMVQYFRFSDERAYVIYGSYTALVYATPVFGGMLADRILGYKKAVVLGGILMACGHFAMAFDRGFYPALGFLIVGNGFFKPNISTMVGRLYPPLDKRRDAGFTIFYMGINLGAALSPALCGAIGQAYGWHYGFSLAGIGMLLGLAVFLSGQRSLAALKEPPDGPRIKQRAAWGLSPQTMVYLGSIGAVLVAWQLVQYGAWVGRLLSFLGVAVVLALVVYLLRLVDRVVRDRLIVALILTLFSVVFWSFFEQAGSSLNLFTDRNVDRQLSPTSISILSAIATPLGTKVPREIPTSMFQAVNPVFILLLAPLFSALWMALGRKGREPSLPMKFSLGILSLGLGFGALWFGATRMAHGGIVGVGWLLLGYLLQTIGELCLSPIGISMITKLSPPQITGLMMGTWFLSTAFAQYAAGVIATLTGVTSEGQTAAALPPSTVSVLVYGDVFGGVALTAIIIGIILALTAPALSKRTRGVQ